VKGGGRGRKGVGAPFNFLPLGATVMRMMMMMMMMMNYSTL